MSTTLPPRPRQRLPCSRNFRPTLVVSGTEDKYARDADEVVAKVGGDFITELRVQRGHALDQERFDAIVAWIVERVGPQ